MSNPDEMARIAVQLARAEDANAASIGATNAEPEPDGPMLAPNPHCEYCYGSGERYWHSEDCDDDLCALNGDIYSCQGEVQQCPCTMPAA